MELRIPTPEQLRTVYDVHLREAFPAAELKPLASMERLWREGRYRPLCLFDGREILGEAFMWLGHPGWGLLDYLCVAPDCRGAGLGAVILQELREKESGVIFGESEAPEDAPDPAMAERRLGFYIRNGLRTAGYDTEMFGVHYKTLYLADGDVDGDSMMQEHRFIYQSAFRPDRFAQYIRIPRQAGAAPGEKVPWEQ